MTSATPNSTDGWFEPSHLNAGGLAELDRETVLRYAAEQVCRECEMDLGMVAERVDDIDTLTVRSVAGARTDKMIGLVVPAGIGLGGQVAVLRQPKVVEDYIAAADISHDLDPAWRAEGIRTAIAVPIVRGYELYGVLYGASRSIHTVDSDLVAHLNRIARQVGTGLRVADQAAEMVEKAVQDERRRLAVSLHESVRSILLGVAQATRDLRSEPDCTPRLTVQLDDIDAEVARALGELRQGLRALPPEAVALGVALQHVCADFQERTTIPTRTVLLGQPPDLEPAHAGALLQITREALYKAERAGAATSIRVCLQVAGAVTTLIVTDDTYGAIASAGFRGFGTRDPGAPAPAPEGSDPLAEALRRVMSHPGGGNGLDLTTEELPTVALTGREVDVLRRAATGATNPEIAAEMGISRNTVKGYITAALQKLGARNRVEAFVKARDAGLI